MIARTFTLPALVMLLAASVHAADPAAKQDRKSLGIGVAEGLDYTLRLAGDVSEDILLLYGYNHGKEGAAAAALVDFYVFDVDGTKLSADKLKDVVRLNPAIKLIIRPRLKIEVKSPVKRDMSFLDFRYDETVRARALAHMKAVIENCRELPKLNMYGVMMPDLPGAVPGGESNINRRHALFAMPMFRDSIDSLDPDIRKKVSQEFKAEKRKSFAWNDEGRAWLSAKLVNHVNNLIAACRQAGPNLKIIQPVAFPGPTEICRKGVNADLFCVPALGAGGKEFAAFLDFCKSRQKDAKFGGYLAAVTTTGSPLSQIGDADMMQYAMRLDPQPAGILVDQACLIGDELPEIVRRYRHVALLIERGRHIDPKKSPDLLGVGGFEKDSDNDGYPDGWGPFPAAIPGGRWTSNAAEGRWAWVFPQSGQNVIRGIASAPVTVKPGQAYLVTLRRNVRGEMPSFRFGGETRPGAGAYWYDSRGTLLGVTCIAADGGPKSSDWQACEFVVEAPWFAATLRIGLCHTGPQRIAYDQILVRAVPNEAPKRAEQQ